MATMYRRGRAWQSVDITVKLMTGKTLSFSQIPLNTSIKELKLKVEDACGIPSQCQRLTYLDMCDMFDHKTLEQSDVVDRGRFNMKVWAPFGALVNAASGGHITQVFQSGLINNRGFLNQDEAFLALYIAAHGGHIRLVLMILSYGVNVNFSTKLGRTALHAAGIKGQWSVLCLLINWGANIYSKDESGYTAMDYARMFGHRESARGLALYEWHLNKEQHVRKKQSASADQSIDIMSQFPPHWIAEVPGCNVKQIFSPPVTMNLVAARAANMLVILPEMTGREDTEHPPSPNYVCGRDHAIPGVSALNIKKNTRRVTLPPLTTQRSTPPNYDEWLITKSKQKAQRVKKIQEELDLEAEEKRKKEVEKQIRARDAFEKWVRVRAPNQRLFNLHDRARVGTV